MKGHPYALLHRGPNGEDVFGPERLTYPQALTRFHSATDPSVVGVYRRDPIDGNVVVFRKKAEKEKANER